MGETETINSLVADFEDPPAEYGPIPLWWWDGDEFDKSRMTEQLEALAGNGVPGVCFISKLPNGPHGNTPRYFTEEWWDVMEHVVAECDRLGMELWVHDETYHHSPPTWWEFWQDHIRTEATETPSLRGEVLHREYATVTDGEDATLQLPREFEVRLAAAYPYRDDGTLDIDDAVELDVEDGVLEWSGRAGDWHVTAIGHRPKGLCYTDSTAVERYLDLHYEEYVRRLGDAVGDVLVGTFEDELRILDEELPFDDQVRRRFRDEKGYDLVPSLVSLYERTGETTDVRTDYYDVVVSLLEENWFEPLYEWHETHDLLRAHDNWGRNDLSAGTEQYGDYYRTMRWYQAPGYDDGGPAAIGERNFFDAKLSASIAACYDRDRVWGELFHSTTWGFRPQSQLAGIVENICYGCNLYDKHGCYYTTKGGWWAHAPPDVHFRQPYWEDVGDLNAAAHRLSRVMSEGTPVVDAALAFPIATLHADWHPEEGIGSTGQTTDESTRDLAATLYYGGTDLVLADDDSLAGAATDGHLEVGGMEIPSLVLPPSNAVAAETLTTARELYESGGVVVSVGGIPETIVGGDDDALVDLFGETWDGTLRVREHETGGIVALAPEDSDVTDIVSEYVNHDVRCDTPDVFHTHRTVDGDDLYLLFNARDEARTVEVALRSEGMPEQWDPMTGKIEPFHEFDREGGYTVMTFEFEPHDFVLIALRENENRPRLVEHTREFDVTAVTEEAIEGYKTADTEVHAEVAIDGTTHTVGVDGESPVVHELNSGWELDLEPNLHNEWGDFRYPPSGETLGPEVREFRYRLEQDGEDGRAQNWYDPRFDATDWQRVQWSYGPGFWRKTDVDPGATPDNPQSEDWEPYEFSELVGKPDTHPYLMGYMSTLSDHYLVSPDTEDGEERTYFWTTVRTPEPGTYLCHYGPGIESLTIGDREVEAVDEHDYDWLNASGQGGAGDTVSVRLPQGETTVLLATDPGVETYFALDPESGSAFDRDLSYVPRVRWFHGDGQGQAYFDAYAWKGSAVGWYRFEVPVGTTAFDLPVRGTHDVWLDGEPRDVVESRISLSHPLESPSQVTVRVEHESGSYGGAAWTAPVNIETDTVTVDVGDWRNLGLDSYSGRGTYRRVVDFPDPDEKRLLLELGDVAVAATVRIDGEEVGSTFAPPFTVDLTEHIQGGEHVVEVDVANTLSNHFKTETPKEYRDFFTSDDEQLLDEHDSETQFAGGLHGPVTLRIEPFIRSEIE